ncbi:MAG: hypothetical protein DMG77_18100 [Acidobacteria bacterium]|nr:MAG: hypothetical protein DMG77_18100 [Acidobacteriota bacterium]
MGDAISPTGFYQTVLSSGLLADFFVVSDQGQPFGAGGATDDPIGGVVRVVVRKKCAESQISGVIGRTATSSRKI